MAAGEIIIGDIALIQIRWNIIIFDFIIRIMILTRNVIFFVFVFIVLIYYDIFVSVVTVVTVVVAIHTLSFIIFVFIVLIYFFDF